MAGVSWGSKTGSLPGDGSEGVQMVYDGSFIVSLIQFFLCVWTRGGIFFRRLNPPSLFGGPFSTRNRYMNLTGVNSH